MRQIISKMEYDNSNSNMDSHLFKGRKKPIVVTKIGGLGMPCVTPMLKILGGKIGLICVWRSFGLFP